ncbi:YdeI/OmpD-associated family protein [Wenyingzhuangia gilva]|uniref:YdeI/OmpD-associated family protein n=1 Tax=Wenyingzhuangia gilva TaxID=3057677 RepID=UPI0030B9404F
MNPKVDEYLDKLKNWQEELVLLRAILLDCMLTEEIKWRVPCYTFNNKNVLILANFKDYCAISFLKGTLLKDTENILVSPGENSRSVKYLKFTKSQEVQKLTPIIKAYVYEAIEVEKAGLKVDLKKSTDLDLVEELIDKMNQDSTFQKAFNALTP